MVSSSNILLLAVVSTCFSLVFYFKADELSALVFHKIQTKQTEPSLPQQMINNEAEDSIHNRYLASMLLACGMLLFSPSGCSASTRTTNYSLLTNIGKQIINY